jgi:hypothetical protein
MRRKEKNHGDEESDQEAQEVEKDPTDQATHDVDGQGLAKALRGSGYQIDENKEGPPLFRRWFFLDLLDARNRPHPIATYHPPSKSTLPSYHPTFAHSSPRCLRGRTHPGPENGD